MINNIYWCSGASDIYTTKWDEMEIFYITHNIYQYIGTYIAIVGATILNMCMGFHYHPTILYITTSLYIQNYRQDIWVWRKAGSWGGGAVEVTLWHVFKSNIVCRQNWLEATIPICKYWRLRYQSVNIENESTEEKRFYSSN